MIRNNTCDQQTIHITYIHINGNEMAIKWGRCIESNVQPEQYIEHVNKGFACKNCTHEEKTFSNVSSIFTSMVTHKGYNLFLLVKFSFYSLMKSGVKLCICTALKLDTLQVNVPLFFNISKSTMHNT